MKLLTRTAFVFLTALALVAAAYGYSGTDIACAVTGGNIYFDKSSGTVTDCDESVTEAVIPAQIDGIAVTAIGTMAFFGCRGLTSVEIPDGVTSIGELAFCGCHSLTSVEIPNSVTSIGARAFNVCIGLTSIEIPNGVTSIGEEAFFNCVSLTSVEIPNSVTSIGELAFCGCSGLTNIHVTSGNQQYVSIDGVLFDKSQTILICYPGGKTGVYQIPDSVISIEGYAFCECSGLTSVKIPDSVTFIGYSAFSGCSGLTSVEIPDSVTFIGRSAFSDCSGLTSVEIPNSVTSIGEWAFAYCSGLTSVEIPNSVTFIRDYAFSACDALRDVYYSGSKEQWEAINGINNSGLMYYKITIHYNASMPSAPEFTIPSAPTVGGNAIRQADLSGLTEISVPLTISGETAVSVTVCASFFDGNGKFLGAGYVTTTADSATTSVTAPVTGNVSGATRLKVVVADADFRPLCAAPFDIAA